MLTVFKALAYFQDIRGSKWGQNPKCWILFQIFIKRVYCDFTGTFSLPEYLLPDHLSVHPILQFQILWGLQNTVQKVYCYLKTVKNEGILTSAIFFSLLADWETETVGTQNTYCYLQTLEIKQIYITGIIKGKLQSVEQLL